MNVIFWDTETNGLRNYHSVLSISAIKYSFSIEQQKIISAITDRYERFYFRKPGEKFGAKAVNVNGLTDKVIHQRRENAEYPKHFYNDIEAFRLFCSDTQHFVGHNIFYDKQYINFQLPHEFCTMKANTKILCLKQKNGRPKFPSLEETATFYGVEFIKSQLHGSMYDSLVTYQIFIRMLESEMARDVVMGFLEKGFSG
ncbi:MAG: 3'-5' exonuclease [Treponema sp.]|nr:3'-5' exonuclease [Treponema sp.]